MYNSLSATLINFNMYIHAYTYMDLGKPSMYVVQKLKSILL